MNEQTELALTLSRRFRVTVDSPKKKVGWRNEPRKPEASTLPATALKIAPKPQIELNHLISVERVRVIIPSLPIAEEVDRVERPYHRTTFSVKGGRVFGHFFDLPEGAKAGDKVIANVTLTEKIVTHEGRVTRSTHVECEVLAESPQSKASLIVHSPSSQFKSRPETMFAHAPYETDGTLELRQSSPAHPSVR